MAADLFDQGELPAGGSPQSADGHPVPDFPAPDHRETDQASDGDGADSAYHFADGKAPGALRTIGEVSKALSIPPHVLRYWEERFPMLRPMKRSGGRRYYRPEDVALIETIDRLVHREGYTLRGARKLLTGGKANGARGNASARNDSEPIRHDKAIPAPVEPMPEPLAEPLRPHVAIASVAAILPQLRTLRDRLASALED